MFKRIVLVVCLVAFAVSSALADAGKSGWVIFKKAQASDSRRSASLSLTNSSIPSVFTNPAISGMNKHRELYFVSEMGFAEDRLTGILYGEPVRKGMLICGFVYYDAGSIELNWFDGGGDLVSETVSLQKDMLGFVSYSRLLGRKVSFGATLKAARSEIVERKSAIAYGADMGIAFLPSKKITISAALQNLGVSTKFSAKEAPLPFSGNLGFTYSVESSKNIHFMPGILATYNFVDEKIIPEAGFEIGFGAASINAGYILNGGDSNLYFGLGLKSGSMDLTYSYIPGVYLGAVQRLNLGYRFRIFQKTTKSYSPWYRKTSLHK